MRPSIWPQLFYIGIFILSNLTRAQQVSSISHASILATKTKQISSLLVRGNESVKSVQQVSSARSDGRNQGDQTLAQTRADDTPFQHTPVGQQRELLRRYAVVVDCGSSGTRVQIFYWPVTSTNSSSNNRPGKLTAEFAYRVETLRNATNGQPLSLRIRPGLASVRDTPDAASDYLAPMMRFASTWVPASEHSQTPVYIMGTAGMRTLAPREQAAILADIERDLASEFAFRPITAEVISGPDEGYYQWLSINTLARRLGPGYDLAVTPSARSRRLGLVEMGGYSAQVAFEASAQLEALVRRRLKRQPAAWHAYTGSSRTIDLSGGGGSGPTRILSISFLGFGSDMARQWAVDLLVRDSLAYLRQVGLLATLRSGGSSQLSLDDPCLPHDSRESITKPMSLLANQAARTLNYNVQSGGGGEPTFQVHLRGRGNFFACLALLNRLVKIAKVEQTTCYAGATGGGDQRDQSEVCEAPLIGTNFLPWRELQFVGLGELYYTSHEMLRASGRFDGPRIKWEAANICRKSLELINAQYPSGDSGTTEAGAFIRRRNQLACFKATWLLAWLSAALRMPMAGVPPTHNKWATANLTTTQRVDGQEVDWKLGAVLAKTCGS